MIMFRDNRPDYKRVFAEKIIKNIDDLQRNINKFDRYIYDCKNNN